MSYVIHSPRLIWHLKSDGWKTTFRLGRPIFRGGPLVSGGLTVSNVAEVRNSTKGKLVSVAGVYPKNCQTNPPSTRPSKQRTHQKKQDTIRTKWLLFLMILFLNPQIVGEDLGGLKLICFTCLEGFNKTTIQKNVLQTSGNLPRELRCWNAYSPLMVPSPSSCNVRNDAPYGCESRDFAVPG